MKPVGYYISLVILIVLFIVSIVLDVLAHNTKPAAEVAQSLAQINTPLVTFIIPSVNRPTLQRTLDSLKKQTEPNWSAVVVLDGVPQSEVHIDGDTRIQYMFLKKKLGSMRMRTDRGHGRGALVRDYGIEHSQTGTWLAFVDDDDELDPNYVYNLAHITKVEKPQTECIIFRMMLPNGVVLPPHGATDFYRNQVGISFAIRRKLFDEGFKFASNDDTEDFNLLNRLRRAKRNIYIAPYVMYYVH